MVGATVAVALTLGIGQAHAGDQLVGIAAEDSSDLLVIASTNFADARDVITGIDTADLSETLLSAVESMHRYAEIMDREIAVVDALAPAESVILAHSGELAGFIDQWFLDPLNQQWADASESMLGAAQTFDSAIADGSLPATLSALWQVIQLSFAELLPVMLASAPVVWIGNLFDDAAATADLLGFST